MMRSFAFSTAVVLSLAAHAAFGSLKPAGPRRVVNLDGQWQVAQGVMDTVPTAFSHTVPVPGLIDMARPAFDEVGRKSILREAFWYRRTFKVDGPVPATAVLKIHKARYGTQVWLNGEKVGEHLPCFTPAYLDVKKQLKGEGQDNELVIRVGADRDALPAGQPDGWDFEKYLFIPGIYDSVELILTGAPYIVNVQTVPDIAERRVRAVVEVQGAGEVPVEVEVAEAAGGKVVGSGKATARAAEGGVLKADVTIPVEGCKLWSPESPFLYELRVSTGADGAKTRFGMRSFRFDPKLKRAVLNDKPYVMRGTNICIYRFLEDENRADLPWRADWVRKLHQQFQAMHWDSVRYCIGFPPEFWYDIADELGVLIQDEFPIWTLGDAPKKPTADKIIPEYVEWMRERWNHPCVVIWDAQNESSIADSGKALQAVRQLDLSNRPWENGWAEPQSPTDCVESHPYFFIRNWGDAQKPFRMRELEGMSGVPSLNDAQKKLNVPIIINEYCWLWLNRDGTPTCLTQNVYENLVGKNASTQQRRMAHARTLAALTEFWRCHREAAGVLHFCGLGYSRSGDKPRPEGGATSDHFIDLEKLTYEPLFQEYVGEAFNPVGLMLDFWAETAAPGLRKDVRVFVINDLYADWSGKVSLKVCKGDQALSEIAQEVKVVSLGRETPTFALALPDEPGDYTLVAELQDGAGKRVRSLRDVKVVKAQ